VLCWCFTAAALITYFFKLYKLWDYRKLFLQ
jgi:hypothetical protein